MFEKSIPHLPAWQWAEGEQAAVWCKYCRVYHWHGFGDTGHRIAHCWLRTSPYRQSDYILVDAGPPPREIVADFRWQGSARTWKRRIAAGEFYSVSPGGVVVRTGARPAPAKARSPGERLI